MLLIEYAKLSKNGDRNVNEDCVGICAGEHASLFCLADGLGGHGRGEVASRLAVDAAVKTFEEGKDDGVLSDCFAEAHNAVLSKQEEDHAKDEIKTTLTLLLVQGDTAHWGHIGDSRLCLFKKNKFYARTLDHSVPQMLVNSGAIKDKDIRFHEDRNRLTRVIGDGVEMPAYELAAPAAISHGDAFLLCSDGFWELIDEKEMARLLKKSRSPESWLAAMEAVVLKNGQKKDMDNYSAVAVFI